MTIGRRLALMTVGALAWVVATVAGAIGHGHLTDTRARADCRPHASATTAQYLIGVACPPAGFTDAFGYEPVLVETHEGWRFTRPASTGAHCNGPIGDEGPFWDFADACRTHDYGYDLVRFGSANRRVADQLLYDDMVASCSDRSFVGAVGCRAIAGSARAVLAVGDLLGFDPEPLPRRVSPERRWRRCGTDC